MPGDPRDQRKVATLENDPANLVFEEWIKLREAQGWSREAAYTELMIAREALLTARGSSEAQLEQPLSADVPPSEARQGEFNDQSFKLAACRHARN